MKKITKITKSNIPEIRNLIKSKLNELSELGIEFDLSSIRYDDTSLRTKIECNIIGSESKEVKEYERFKMLYSLLDLGTEFKHMGKVYKISGFNNRARKNKLLFSDSTGKFHGPVAILENSQILS